MGEEVKSLDLMRKDGVGSTRVKLKAKLSKTGTKNNQC